MDLGDHVDRIVLPNFVAGSTVKEKERTLNETLRRSREIERGSARSTKPSYLKTEVHKGLDHSPGQAEDGDGGGSILDLNLGETSTLNIETPGLNLGFCRRWLGPKGASHLHILG